MIRSHTREKNPIYPFSKWSWGPTLTEAVDLILIHSKGTSNAHQKAIISTRWGPFSSVPYQQPMPCPMTSDLWKYSVLRCSCWAPGAFTEGHRNAEKLIEYSIRGCEIIYIYILYTPNGTLSFNTMVRQERERGRFTPARDGASRRTG